MPFLMTSSFGFSIGRFEVWTPRLNGFGLVLLILYGILNFDTLSNLRLDHLEARGKL